MHLVLNGLRLPIAQLGPDFLILEKTAQHPPADAEILLRVDAAERRWPVKLPEGLVAGVPTVIIAQAV